MGWRGREGKETEKGIESGKEMKGRRACELGDA